jgi:hypothetical protein
MRCILCFRWPGGLTRLLRAGARRSPSYAGPGSGGANAGGGGLAEHGEAIEVLALPLAHLGAFLLDDSLPKSSGMMFALLWAAERVRRGGGRLRPPQAAA